MLTDRKLLVLGLSAIPPLGAALLLTATAPKAYATCSNTNCVSPGMCQYHAGLYCALDASSCTVKFCC